MPLTLRLVLALFGLASCAFAGSYVGAESCALCHRNIADRQAQTAMAQTWRGRTADVKGQISDGALYRLFQQNGSVIYSTLETNFPVEEIVGGVRHGLGFLFRTDHVGALPLDRTLLLQARHFWSFKNGGQLVLAPGLSDETPHSYESALGLALSPAFEKQCLACHGQPHTLGAGKQGGVHCESCHGPGAEHLRAISKGNPRAGIVNLAKLSSDAAIQTCAQCHEGFGRHIDPAPADLLIANQVQALRASECFVQSGRAFSCTTCHDPHQDARGNDSAAVKACLGCHNIGSAKHAAICPVNPATGCISCHMPNVDIGPLHLVDHWIRIHPEQMVAAGARVRSQFQPLREFLRIIKTDQRDKILAAQRQIESGQSFYDTARSISTDPTASIGGFWGEREVAQLEPALRTAAVQLDYGETSSPTESSSAWYLLQRLPHDFKWRAEQVQNEAETLLAHGDITAALKKSQESLKIYPQSRRALTFIGTTYAQAGNQKRSVEILRLVHRLYPEDAVSLFALAVSLGALNQHAEEIEAYRSVLKLEPDFVAAYARLGATLIAQGDLGSAISTLREGLRINPLSAEICRELSDALQRRGDTKQSARYAALASRLAF